MIQPNILYSLHPHAEVGLYEHYHLTNVYLPNGQTLTWLSVQLGRQFPYTSVLCSMGSLHHTNSEVSSSSPNLRWHHKIPAHLLTEKFQSQQSWCCSFLSSPFPIYQSGNSKYVLLSTSSEPMLACLSHFPHQVTCVPCAHRVSLIQPRFSYLPSCPSSHPFYSQWARLQCQVPIAIDTKNKKINDLVLSS